MSIPSLLLGFVISTLIGALFHFWRGGNLGRLLLYLILSWIGFGVGQFIASYLNTTFDIVGQIHVVIASLGSLIFLGVGYWLSLVQVEKKAS